MVSLPDGYRSNFSNKVDKSFIKFQNIKSHDYRIFMQVLFPTAFSVLPGDVLEPLPVLGEFFKNLSANLLHQDLLVEIHCNIAIILYKLETIFSPRFWNVMEHLPLYLTQEAHFGGPIHYGYTPLSSFFTG